MIQEEFCQYCDYGYNGFNNCKDRKSVIYLGWCGNSSIEGVPTLIKEDSIFVTYTNRAVLHGDLEALRDEIRKAKETGLKLFQPPKVSPLEKAIWTSQKI